MRPYCASDQHFAFVLEHGRYQRRHRRAHGVPRDQAMRRYDASRARQEARKIVRAEHREYLAGLAEEAREQAAADLSTFCWDDLYSYSPEHLHDYCNLYEEITHAEWEKEQAWQDHEAEEACVRAMDEIYWTEEIWQEFAALDRYEETGRLDPI